MAFYLHRNGESVVYDVASLRAMAHRGELAEDEYVFDDRKGEWLGAATIAELQGAWQLEEDEATVALTLSPEQMAALAGDDPKPRAAAAADGDDEDIESAPTLMGGADLSAQVKAEAVRIAAERAAAAKQEEETRREAVAKRKAAAAEAKRREPSSSRVPVSASRARANRDGAGNRADAAPRRKTPRPAKSLLGNKAQVVIHDDTVPKSGSREPSGRRQAVDTPTRTNARVDVTAAGDPEATGEVTAIAMPAMADDVGGEAEATRTVTRQSNRPPVEPRGPAPKPALSAAPTGPAPTSPPPTSAAPTTPQPTAPAKAATPARAPAKAAAPAKAPAPVTNTDISAAPAQAPKRTGLYVGIGVGVVIALGTLAAMLVMK